MEKVLLLTWKENGAADKYVDKPTEKKSIK